MFASLPSLKPFKSGALFISTLARERLPTPTYPPEDHLDVLSLVIMPITYFIILISILVHGLSIPIFTSSRRLQRRVSSFQRTYTAGSQAEPGWLSKVRRAGEPERSSSKDDDEKVEQTPSPSGSAEAEQADVMGSHNQGVAIEDGHPERITRWKEGGRTIVEDSEGEVVDVDNQGSAQTAPKVIDLEAQAPPKGSKRKQQAEEALDGAEEDEDSDHQRYHWWKRDAKTGKPRELTPDERRQARRDRFVMVICLCTHLISNVILIGLCAVNGIIGEFDHWTSRN